jgi:hypothetical protein
MCSVRALMQKLLKTEKKNVKEEEEDNVISINYLGCPN